MYFLGQGILVPIASSRTQSSMSSSGQYNEKFSTTTSVTQSFQQLVQDNYNVPLKVGLLIAHFLQLQMFQYSSMIIIYNTCSPHWFHHKYLYSYFATIIMTTNIKICQSIRYFKTYHPSTCPWNPKRKN